MASSKRASTVPAGPKPPTSISPTAVISDTAFIVGTNRVTIRESTVIHPRAKIDASHAAVSIGSFCIICERSVVGIGDANSVQARPDGAQSAGVMLGNGVSVEAGALVQAQSVGDGCVIEVNAKVGPGAVLGKHCKVGPMCEINAGEVISDYTVVYGTGKRRVDRSGTEDIRLATMKRHVEVLAKLIPSNLAKWQ